MEYLKIDLNPEGKFKQIKTFFIWVIVVPLVLVPALLVLLSGALVIWALEFPLKSIKL